MLVADIILAAWQLLRVAQIRAGLIAPGMVTAQRCGYSHPMSFSMDTYNALAKLDRHHAQLQRTVERNLKLLRELQAEAAEEETTDYTDQTEVQNEATGEPEAEVATPLITRDPESFPLRDAG